MNVELHNMQIRGKIKELEAKKKSWEYIMPKLAKLESVRPFCNATDALEATKDKIEYYKRLFM
ncbi:hypothetical protein EBB07_29345 [Paenibacillaceae bacterium]|nr:hypothetical protein EBB07_29345 [Paenibacillaceae bacterium]